VNRLPPKIESKLRETLRTTHALSETVRWLESRDVEALVLQGDTGSGKSLAAAWAFRFIHHRTRPSQSGQYAWPVWLDAAIVSSWRTWDPKFDEVDAAPLVVVDDVGTESQPAAMQLVIERLWNVSSGRVLITTNLDPETFCGRYGDRVRSRVGGTAAWVACAEEDMRMFPPTTPDFRGPEQLTHSEQQARAAELAVRDAEQAAWEADAEDRERWMAEHMRNIRELTDSKRHRVAPQDDAWIEERRAALQRQVEARKAGE
jgi:hypothetical protein